MVHQHLDINHGDHMHIHGVAGKLPLNLSEVDMSQLSERERWRVEQVRSVVVVTDWKTTLHYSNVNKCHLFSPLQHRLKFGKSTKATRRCTWKCSLS